VLSMQRLSMVSRMRMIEKTWTSEADELAGPSSYKYKYKYMFFKIVPHVNHSL